MATRKKSPAALKPRLATSATSAVGPVPETGEAPADAMAAPPAGPLAAPAGADVAAGDPEGKAPAKASAKPPVKARSARPSPVDEMVARHQKDLAEGLAKARAIVYDKPAAQPAAPKAAEAKAGETKPAKARKPRLVRDSFAMPEKEYACLPELKKRLAGLGREVKKSELLRAGVALLAALGDDELLAVMGRVERIKTGRPSKK